MGKAFFPDVLVNGEKIPQAAIAAEAQNHAAPKGKPGIAWRKAANALAVRALILQEARRKNIACAPQEVRPGQRETDEEALIRGLLDSEISVTPPSEDAIKAEWARDPERFRAPPLWEVSHILCAYDPDDPAARDAAYRRAAGLAERLSENPAGFARLAADHSDCGSKSAGGALGQLGPGDTVPQFEKALRSLSEGEITAQPVLSRYGWHIIRMDASAEGSVLPYDVVREKIAEALEKNAWAREAQAVVARLIANAEITGAELQSL